ncbi:MAG: hypothetical protein KKE86_05870 [Planctomycetes bacterium]|nr:hypothetical protein [Planctomycetota bacterium]
MNAKYWLLLLTFIILHSTFIISHAQVVRLPAVAPAEAGPPGRLVSHPDSSAEILQMPGELGVAPATAPQSEPQLPPGVRGGVFQKLLFDAAWLAPGGNDGMGMNDLQLQSIFALPCPTIDSPLLITPGFAVHYLQGPRRVDLPPRLHEGYVQFRWLSQLNSKLGLDLAITPGVYSDFRQEAADSFRLTGHGAAAWNWTDKAKVVLGAAYLDRPDAEVIPIGGVVWTPHEDVKFDLVFPHPRISRRIYWGGCGGDDKQDWVYLAGEFAGDAWAIRRADGSDDQVVLSDYRVILGLERKVSGGLSSRFEVGYVFSRRIRYTSGTPEYRPTDTVMLRGGLTY